MARVLNDAKKAYPYFFREGVLNDEGIKEFFKNRGSLPVRQEVIKFVYGIILEHNNNLINDYVKTWLKGNLSIRDSARIQGINGSTLSSYIHYFEVTVGKTLHYKDSNIFSYCLWTEVIESYDAKKIREVLNNARYKFNTSKYNLDKVIANKNLLINIPKEGFTKDLSDEEFYSFMSMIKPYFTSERKRVQDRINEMTNAVGYFNYITCSNNNILSDTDRTRLDIIKALVSEEDIEAYREAKKAKELNEKISKNNGIITESDKGDNTSNNTTSNENKEDIQGFDKLTEEQKKEATQIKTTKVKYNF